MRTYSCRPPVFKFTPVKKVKPSKDRIAHDELFCAIKRFFDSLTDEQRAALNKTPELCEKFNPAYDAAEQLYFHG